MDLTTTYMGYRIANPLIVSSSGLTNSADNIRKCADNGAGAIVLKSLFEEQIIADKKKLLDQDDMYFWYPEAIDYVSRFSKEHGISQYLKLVEDAKKTLKIPLVASINCVSPREWPLFAKELENSGADGIELNIFIPPAKMELTGYKIEETYLDIVREVRKNTSLPIGVKIGFYFSNLYRTILSLSSLEIDNIVMFNRYYRPDIDIEKMQILSNKIYSTPDEITLSLRWIALLSNAVRCNLVAATGIHDYSGVIKQIMAGASAVQLCTAIYINGFEHIFTILNDMENWMKAKKYNDIESFKGIITKSEENNIAFERIQFMKKTTGKI
ncbi:MAG: dihydroorotate dehydrogenase-like protein [Bacteroidales bacterium]|nr:dihydroorotate dehydrogenase-like protein [Bacteroidales bacterium]